MKRVGECVCATAVGLSPPRGASEPPITFDVRVDGLQRVVGRREQRQVGGCGARPCRPARTAAARRGSRFGSLPTITSRTPGIAARDRGRVRGELRPARSASAASSALKLSRRRRSAGSRARRAASTARAQRRQLVAAGAWRGGVQTELSTIAPKPARRASCHLRAPGRPTSPRPRRRRRRACAPCRRRSPAAGSAASGERRGRRPSARSAPDATDRPADRPVRWHRCRPKRSRAS